jgi:translation initiation factor IF-2
LENVIIDWNAIRKIHRRFEELASVKATLADLKAFLTDDIASIKVDAIKGEGTEKLLEVVLGCMNETQNLLDDTVQLDNERQ